MGTHAAAYVNSRTSRCTGGECAAARRTLTCATARSSFSLGSSLGPAPAPTRASAQVEAPADDGARSSRPARVRRRRRGSLVERHGRRPHRRPAQFARRRRRGTWRPRVAARHATSPSCASPRRTVARFPVDGHRAPRPSPPSATGVFPIRGAWSFGRRLRRRPQRPHPPGRRRLSPPRGRRSSPRSPAPSSSARSSRAAPATTSSSATATASTTSSCTSSPGPSWSTAGDAGAGRPADRPGRRHRRRARRRTCTSRSGRAAGTRRARQPIDPLPQLKAWAAARSR